MGLDISAYSKLRYVGLGEVGTKTEHGDDEDYHCGDPDHIQAFAYASFPHALQGLTVQTPPDDFFDGAIGGDCFEQTADTEAMGFRAGSYSGYNAFRAELAQLAGRTVEDYWQGRANHEPFYELINFADNEGVLSPDCAKALIPDFEQHRGAFLTRNQDSYWIETYDEWLTALRLAADDGLVVFH